MKLRHALAIFCLLCIAAPIGAKDAPTSAVGLAMTQAAERFLAALDAEDRALAVMDFDNPARLDWHNIPKPQRKGLQLRDMSPQQQELCHALLRTALSDAGYVKAERILALENNLREGEKNNPQAPLRDPLRYFLTIFGAPAATGQWGWSFEGHHLSLNFVIRDGQVVADTPSFWGANPATVKTFVPGGPEVGVRTLTEEEQLAFDLLASLDESQRQRAVIADEAPADYRGPGAPQPPQDPPAGLPAAEMTNDQQEILASLLGAYCGHLAAELAAARNQEIETAGLERVHFAWLGAQEPGAPHAYRVQGPTFVLELVNFQSDPAGNPANHIHSVWRRLPRDFALPAADAGAED
jgi:hypothetical protein